MHVGYAKHSSLTQKQFKMASQVALALKGTAPSRAVAEHTGLSQSTVNRLWKGNDLSSPQIEAVKNVLKSKYYFVADAAVNHITDAKLEKCDPYRLALTSGILLDKARLIEGLSTENINFKSLSVTINAELNQLKEQRATLARMLAEGGR